MAAPHLEETQCEHAATIQFDVPSVGKFPSTSALFVEAGAGTTNSGPNGQV